MLRLWDDDVDIFFGIENDFDGWKLACVGGTRKLINILLLACESFFEITYMISDVPKKLLDGTKIIILWLHPDHFTKA